MRSAIADAPIFALLAVVGCAGGPAPRICPPPPPAPPPAPVEKGDAVEASKASPVVPVRELDVAVEPPARHERYWGAVAVVDVVGIAVAAPAMTKPQPLWLVPYVSLAPLVHVAYGEPVHAAESLLLRAAMSSLAYATTRAARPEDCSEGRISPDVKCVAVRGALPFVVAMTIATVVDLKFLAQRDVPLEEWTRLPVAPAVARSVDDRGNAAWSFSLSGAF